MIRYECSEQIESISLDPLLRKGKIVCLSLPPFIGHLQIRLEINENKTFKGTSGSLDPNEGAFPLPFYISSFKEVLPETFFILTRDELGYIFFFALSHRGQIISLEGDQKKALFLKAKSGIHAAQARDALLCLRGENPYKMIEEAMQAALELTGQFGKTTEEKIVFPRWLNRLGWESGRNFGLQVSHRHVVEAVESLCQAGYPPGFVIVDEGWQDLDAKEEALLSFEAKMSQFPQKLKGLVKDLNKLGVKHVGVWHGMMGARGGIHGDLAKKYNLTSGDQGKFFLGEDLGNTFQFFNDYYRFLQKQGVSFVKVGDQTNIKRFFSEKVDETRVQRNLQTAIQAAASVHFECLNFNTESLQNQNLFYWSSSYIASVSENLNRENPLGAMITIRNGLSNALWMKYLMYPDFNAWQTKEQKAEMIAMFQALSGSINVIADPPGEHDRLLLRKFILPSGIILKADKPLTLCRDSLFVNPLEEKKIYKAFTKKGETGVIGAFNLTSGKRTLQGSISPQDVEDIEGQQFAVLSFHHGFLGVLKKAEALAIALKPQQADIFTLAPIKHGIAVLGCFKLFLSPGSITDVNIESDSIHISSLVAGPIIIYCTREVLEVRRNGAIIPWEYDEKRKTLCIDSRMQILDMASIYSIIFA